MIQASSRHALSADLMAGCCRSPRITVIRPGYWFSLRRNEVGKVISIDAATSWMRGTKPLHPGQKRLVDLARHDYQLAPNVSFTPDRKWIVFRSNLHGPTPTYAVEVEKK